MLAEPKLTTIQTCTTLQFNENGESAVKIILRLHTVQVLTRAFLINIVLKKGDCKLKSNQNIQFFGSCRKISGDQTYQSSNH